MKFKLSEKREKLREWIVQSGYKSTTKTILLTFLMRVVGQDKEFIRLLKDKPRGIMCCDSCGSSCLDDTYCYNCADACEPVRVEMIELKKIDKLKGFEEDLK